MCSPQSGRLLHLEVGKNKLRQGKCAEPAKEAGLDGHAEEEQWTATGGEGARLLLTA